MRPSKFKMASFNNHKRQLTLIYTNGKQAVLHYSDLGIRSNLVEVWIDKETKGYSLGLKEENGRVDYMPYDQPLLLTKDPESVLQVQIEYLIARIKKRLEEKKMSKRYLAEQLHTSDNQVQRLLNPSLLNKNLPQLYQIAALVGLEMELRLKAA